MARPKKEKATTTSKLGSDGFNSLALIDKKYENIRMTDDTVDLEYIPTGSITLDRALGFKKPDGTWQMGGIPRGRMTILEGHPSDGKTTLALSVARQCQLMGGRVDIYDYEDSFIKMYAENCGLDVSGIDDDENGNLKVFWPLCLEDGQEIMELRIKSGKVDLIIIDSLPHMTPRKKILGDDEGKSEKAGTVLADKGKEIGLQARLMTDFMDVMKHWAKHYNVTFLAVNQYRANLSGFGSATQTAGAKATNYCASLRVGLKKIDTDTRSVYNELTGKDEEEPVAIKVRFKIDKSKVGIPHREGELSIRLGEGVDDVRTLMEIAKNKGILTAKGAWWSYKEPTDPDHFKASGAENVREYLVAHPDILNTITDELGLST